ncbi:alpha/beta hydrolase [soil metagenome]
MPDASSVLIDGPWTHRDYTANGIRLHVAEAGEGPLVLLLHGFPQFWWCWRQQIGVLAEAGYRVVAPDLRGYGASDKPPRGYDAVTLTADIAGLVGALGERDAMVVGHDWGGLIGWTMGALHPRAVRSLVILSMPHPRRLRPGIVSTGRALAASRYVFAAQLPKVPELRLTANDGAYVETMLREWSGPVWRGTADFAAAARRYRSAIQIPQAAYGAMEYYRWAVRSAPRADGLRYAKRMANPVAVPTLQLHGALDPCLLTDTVDGSGRYVDAAYNYTVLDAIGHFPHEEAPELVSAQILAWAGRT